MTPVYIIVGGCFFIYHLGMKSEFYDLIAKSEYLSRYRLSEIAMIAIELAGLGIVKEEFCDVERLYESAFYDADVSVSER